MNEFIERISKLSPKRLVLLAAELQARLQAAEQANNVQPDVKAADDGAVAVIGLGMRMPGGASSPEEFWDFLCRGGDAIEKIPPSRWDVDALYDPDPDAPGKMASQWGGFVPAIDQFDPQFFGITPREAATMDPQQRLMLEASWEAIERAGYAPDSLAGSQTGVFVGACNSDYFHMVLGSGDENLEMYTATGSAHSVISGRISYLLGLQGPSLTVDTACSSSLVALHLACRSLRSGECRMALAGGVNAILAPDTTMVLSKARMMAPDGRCKAFDARADGFVRSEGCGVVVLKRLADAEADGDTILAVVRGSAINQDGRSNGLTAPNGPSQVSVVRAALADAGVLPAAVGYVETHGTGTSLGDPIEVQALAEALGPGRDGQQPLLIGSVKTNLGHLESAAGVTGFIKLVLALQHKSIPPHLHLAQLNPYIPWDELPVHVPVAGGDWRAINGRWLGGVSSFGFSGTNVHMILEAPPAPAAVRLQDVADRPLHLLQLSARSAAALQAQARHFAAWLQTNEAELADVVYTANSGRSHFAHRLACVAAGSDEMLADLRAFAQAADLQSIDAAQIRYAAAPGNRQPAVTFLFSGHGGQYAGMGSELYRTQTVFRDAIDRCDALFRPLLQTSLLAMFERAEGDGPAAPWLQSMTFAQPALFSLQYALAQMWRSWGLEPGAVAGHSIGEYAAACVAGVLRLEDAVTLVAARSRLMDAIPANGAMAAVFADEAVVAEAIAPYADQVAIAAINGPQATVISGVGATVDAVVAALGRNKVRSRRLAVAQGAHSPLIDSVLGEFAAIAATIPYADPQITFVSTLFGRQVTAGEISSADYWVRHLRQPVRFADAMQALAGEGSNVFVEIGPSPMLIAMGQRCLPDHQALWVSSLRPAQTTSATGAAPASGEAVGGADEWRQLLDSIGALFTYGVALDWGAIDRPFVRRRLSLPTYPFERQRCWFSSSAASATRSRPLERAAGESAARGAHRLLHRRLRSAGLRDIVFETEIGRHDPAWLAHHSIFGVVILPSPAYLEMAMSAAELALRETGDLQAGWAVVNFTIHTPLLLPEEGLRTVQLVIKQAGREAQSTGAAHRFQVLAWDAGADDWTLHASGDLQAAVAPASKAPVQLDEVQDRCPQQSSGAAYYEQVRSLGLTFGESFQGIQQLWIGDGEALGRIELPQTLVAEADHYRFHPALLDACFHLLGAPLAKNGMDAAYLLIGIERFELHRPPGPQLWNHTRIVQAAGETFVGDILLYNAAGELVAEACGLQLKRADRAALMRAVGQRPPDWLYQVEWQPQPLPAQAVALPPVNGAHGDGANPHTWLIIADGSGLGERVAELLAARGQRALIRRQATTATEAGLGADIEADLSAGLPVHGVINIAADSTPTDDSSDGTGSGSDRSTSRLLHLVQLLARRPQPLPGGLWIATRGAQPVGGAPTASGIRQAPLWGLGRVVALEQPQLWGGLVDLDGEAGDQADARAAEHLLAELEQSDGEDQVAWRDGRRYVARLQRTTRPQAQDVRLRADATYLITGGLGGLGLQVARWLAQRGAGHLLLMGRRGLRPGAAAQAVAEIEQGGTAITVVAADVADEAAMGSLFARFGADLPPLAGIVHTAADLSSAPVVELDDERLQAMLRPKVHGTLALHRLSAELKLDFFVLFSSTTALLGANGLAHYAAANVFMDSFAHYRHTLGLPALSINWGTWSVMAAASSAEQQRVAEFGLEQMPAEQALDLLGDMLTQEALPQVAVASVNWEALKPAYEARRRRPLLALMATPPARLLPDAGHVEESREQTPEQTPELVAAWQAARPDERTDVVVAALRKTVAKIVGMADPAAIDLHQGLFEMGMDSLMSVELKTRLERQVGRSLPSTLTFNYPTIHDLAGYLEQQVLTALPAEPPFTPAVAPTTIPPASTPGDGSKREIDDLSEDELAQRLMERLSRWQ